MRRRSIAADPPGTTRLDAPTPTESGVYPLGVFSDVEVNGNLRDVEETLTAFSTLGARLRRGRRSI